MTRRYAFTANLAVTVSVDAETVEAAEAQAAHLLKAGVLVIHTARDQHIIDHEIEGDMSHGQVSR